MLAALVFAFGASAAWRIQHVGQVMSIAWLPLAFWLLDRALKRTSMLYGVGAGIVAAFMVLGRDQVAYLGVWLLTGAVLWHWASGASVLATIRRSLLPLAAGALAGVAVASPPILFTLLLQADSNRLVIDLDGAGKGSLHPASLLTLVVPRLFGTDGPLAEFWGPPSPIWGPVDLYLARNMSHVYVGAVAVMLLAGLGWRKAALTARPVRFLLIALAVTFLYTLGRYTPAFQLFFAAVPGVSLYRRPADATFLLGPLIGIYAGYLLHLRLTGALRPSHTIAAVLLALGLLTAALVAYAKGQFGYAAWPLAQAALWLAGAAIAITIAERANARDALLAAAIVAAFTSADLARNNGPNESTALPPATYDVLRPDTADPTIAFLRARLAAANDGQHRERIELAGVDFHWPNASMVHRLDHVLGYNPVRLRWFSDATGAGDHVALPDQRRFSPLMPSYRSPMADLLGLRYVATRGPITDIDPSLKEGDLPLVLRTATAFIYENPRALPRVLFVPEAMPVDQDALIASGRWPEGFDPRRTVLTPRDAEPSPGGPGDVRIVRYRNNEVLVAAMSDKGGYVVLNDAWHPWWSVEIDGMEAPLLRANAIFRAVRVPPGAHEVRFVFRPVVGAIRELRQRLGAARGG